ncbi:hypothetical protein KBD33_01010 [Candidatus Gracilibacteria bacterium]|nr:hypothetical protein [Candidatus Gracilibacteria bacterium]
MAFTIDRNEAALRLGVSTRTIDRHIQLERIRTRRIGKRMFLEEDDVETLRSIDPSRREETYEVIHESPKKEKNMQEKEIVIQSIDSQAMTEFTRLYEDAKRIIAKKDEIIQDLSYRLGKSETELKNSIPAVEYKKATFLLESAKTKNDEDKEDLTGKLKNLEKEINKRNSALIAITMLFVLVLAFSIVFFFYTRL